MLNFAALFLLEAAKGAEGADSGSPIELSIWKLFIIISISAFVIFYIAKRVAEIMVKKKTDTLIDQFGGSDGAESGGDGASEMEDIEKLNKDLEE